MRDDGLAALRGTRDGHGSLTVHWTDPADASQYYIPMSSPFVSKLATLAVDAHAARPFDVIFSHYMEPYAIAGHLAAEITGVPHGHPHGGQRCGTLLKTTSAIRGAVRPRAALCRSYPGSHRAARSPRGRSSAASTRTASPRAAASRRRPACSTQTVRRSTLRPCARKSPPIRIPTNALCCGAGLPAIGRISAFAASSAQSKGTFALLAALHAMKRAGQDFGLVALAHGQPDVEVAFRAPGAGARPGSATFCKFPSCRIGACPNSCRFAAPYVVSSKDFLIDFHSAGGAARGVALREDASSPRPR